MDKIYSPNKDDFMNTIVYVYLDPRKKCEKESKWNFQFQPFYVGIGNYARQFFHLEWVKSRINTNFRNHKFNTIKSILLDNLEPIIEIISTFDNRETAGNLEIEFIKFFGRKNLGTGCLTNLTDGGDGVHGLSKKQWININTKRSRIFCEKLKNNFEFRTKFIESHSGENHWTKTREDSEKILKSTAKKISATLSGKKTWSNGINMKEHFETNEQYNNYIEKVSENSKKNYSEIKKGKSSRFRKTIYQIYQNDNLIKEIEGSREFYHYCKDNNIKFINEWKLIKK